MIAAEHVSGWKGEDADFFTLREGSTVQVRVAVPNDAALVLEFFRNLSPESRRRRFLSQAIPNPEFIQRLCENSNPRATLSLLAPRGYNGMPRVVATGSYHARGVDGAEVAFAVADDLQGKGLGTLLLERLALLAARQNFKRFWAVTQTDNLLMREVFRESGFAVEESLDRGEIEVNLSLHQSEDSQARCDLRHRIATVASLAPFFHPRAVALVGALRQTQSIGARLLEALVEGGFPGSIFPVNPHANAIKGLRAFPSLRELPEPVDLAIVAVPPEHVLQVIDDCAAAQVRALLVITAGFAEVGIAGARLQREVLDKVRSAGMRMIGPNCLGILTTDPSAPLNATFVPAAPLRGGLAMSSDSGGLGLAVLAAAGQMGLGIASFVSVGNRADVSSNDLLEYWEEDPAVRVILLYLESFGNPAPLCQNCPASQPAQAHRHGEGRPHRRRFVRGRLPYSGPGGIRRRRRCCSFIKPESSGRNRWRISSTLPRSWKPSRSPAGGGSASSPTPGGLASSVRMPVKRAG